MFLIPYKSIGNANSFLLGFLPKYIILKDDFNKKNIDSVIGICNENLSTNKYYSGIFGLHF